MANLNIDLKLLVGKANASLGKLTQQAQVADRRFANLEKSVSGVRNTLGLLAGAAAGIGLFKLGQAALSLGTNAIDAASKIETMATQFEVLTGSGAKASAVVKDLTEFTAKTPFQLEGVAKAAQRLLSFGVESDSVKDKLQVLGDISAASGADLGELALIFGQVRVAGKLTGERLLQLQEKGIGAFGPALAKTLGVAESALSKMVSQGKVDFATFEAAFASLNQKGGFAFEGMIKRSRTLEGRTSTLKDNMNLLQADIGNKLLPTFKGLATAATIVVNKIRQNAEVMAFFGNVAAQIPGIVDFVAKAIITFNNAIQNTRQFLNSISIAINKFIGGVLDVVIAANEAEIAFKRFVGNDVSQLEKNNAELKRTREIFGEIANEATQANDQIQKSQDETNKAIQDGSNKVVALIQTEIDAANKQADEKVAADEKKIGSEQRLTQEQLAQMEARRQAQEKLEEQLAAARDLTAQQKEAVRLFDTEAEVLFEEERLVRLEEFFTREQEATLQASLQAAENETQKQLIIEGIVAKGLKAQLKMKQDAIAKEKELERARKAALIGASGDLFGALAGAAALGGRKLFGIAKAFSIGEALIKGYLAVQNALAQVPYPANFVAAAAVGIQTATNVARISQTQPPGFATGGFPGGPDIRTGDKLTVGVNRGEAILNAQQQKNFMDLANTGTAAPQEIMIRNVIELDGQQITESVSRHVADGFELGEIV